MQRQLVLAIYVPTFILAFCAGLLTPILPIFVRDEFVNSYGMIGLVVAAGAIGMIIGDVPAGALVGRLGLKRSMLIGIGGMALGTLAFTWASWVYELVFYAIFVGFASTLWNISRHAYLADASPAGQRGRAIAIFGGINRMGSFVGPIVGGALEGWLGGFEQQADTVEVMAIFVRADGTEVEAHEREEEGQNGHGIHDGHGRQDKPCPAHQRGGKPGVLATGPKAEKIFDGEDRDGEDLKAVQERAPAGVHRLHRPEHDRDDIQEDQQQHESAKPAAGTVLRGRQLHHLPNAFSCDHVVFPSCA